MIKVQQCRKRYSAEDKVHLVLECLTEKRSIEKTCREHQIAPGNFYRWRNVFIKGGIAAFQNHPSRIPEKPTENSNRNNSVEHKIRLIDRYSKCLGEKYPFGSRLPAAVKLEIIDLVETGELPKITALKLMKIPCTTYYAWLKKLQQTGDINNMYTRSNYTKIADRPEVKEQLFRILHAPPSEYGFNRTTWKSDDLQEALEQSEVHIGKHAIRKIIKEAGYRWIKAREVLTSNDPDYRKKLDRIHRILRNLEDREGFFSIDEYGPFSVKHRQGRKLVAPQEVFTVPQWQKSKGVLIMTAALELSTNQVTHFYSEKKNTVEMIKLLDILLEKYKHLDRIYLSWDAASWHESKKLFAKINRNNEMAGATGSTKVEVAPLPGGAQFLNVIESVFSGMARAIIHNSNYQSKDEAMIAIDEYFKERNQFFKQNPKRAGQKIWGKERVTVQFSENQNCKDPKYR